MKSKRLDLPEVLSALSDPVRLCIVRALSASKELPCKAYKTKVAKPTLSHHFKVLKNAGIIRVRVQGTHRFSSLRSKELNAAFPGLLKAVLRGCRR